MSELSFRFLQVARRVDPLLRTHSSQLSSFPSDPPKQTVETTVAVVPTTVYSVQVSSTQVPITVANGEVSVSLVRSFFLPSPPIPLADLETSFFVPQFLQTMSVLLTATATVTQYNNVTLPVDSTSSSSTPVAWVLSFLRRPFTFLPS